MRPLHTFLYLAAAATIAAQDAQLRIGILVPTKVIEKSNRGHDLLLELESLRIRTNTKLAAMDDELQKLSNQLQSPSIGEPGKELIRKQIRDLHFEIKKLQEDGQMEFQKKEQSVDERFLNEIAPIVNELAKEQNLQLVLQFQPGFMAYVVDPSSVFNFSNEIAKRYDAKYKTNTPTSHDAATQKPVQRPTNNSVKSK